MYICCKHTVKWNKLETLFTVQCIGDIVEWFFSLNNPLRQKNTIITDNQNKPYINDTHLACEMSITN